MSPALAIILLVCAPTFQRVLLVYRQF